jgi:hypothetical protein
MTFEKRGGTEGRGTRKQQRLTIKGKERRAVPQACPTRKHGPPGVSLTHWLGAGAERLNLGGERLPCSLRFRPFIAAQVPPPERPTLCINYLLESDQ